MRKVPLCGTVEVLGVSSYGETSLELLLTLFSVKSSPPGWRIRKTYSSYTGRCGEIVWRRLSADEKEGINGRACPYFTYTLSNLKTNKFVWKNAPSLGILQSGKNRR